MGAFISNLFILVPSILSFFSLALAMSADLSSVFIPGLIEELADEEAHNTATLLQHLIQQTHAGRRSRGEEEESK